VVAPIKATGLRVLTIAWLQVQVSVSPQKAPKPQPSLGASAVPDVVAMLFERNVE
jgi:hypothetical protein